MHFSYEKHAFVPLNFVFDICQQGLTNRALTSFQIGVAF